MKIGMQWLKVIPIFNFAKDGFIENVVGAIMAQRYSVSDLNQPKRLQVGNETMYCFEQISIKPSPLTRIKFVIGLCEVYLLGFKSLGAGVQGNRVKFHVIKMPDQIIDMKDFTLEQFANMENEEAKKILSEKLKEKMRFR